jgi:hypothetical protein
MKKTQNLELRMYGLVPYNISPIQQGIQFGHAVVEYGLKFNKTEEYQEWAKHDKTFIILNGGTTNSKISIKDGLPFGSINKHLSTLIENKISLSKFHEPDLGDQLTAVVFLVDERVFNKTKYPDIEETLGDLSWMESIPEKDLKKILFLRNFLKDFRLA